MTTELAPADLLLQRAGRFEGYLRAQVSVVIKVEVTIWQLFGDLHVTIKTAICGGGKLLPS